MAYHLIRTTLLWGLIVPLLCLSGCVSWPEEVEATRPHIVEPTPGTWTLPEEDQDWITTCGYEPQADVDELISCLQTTKYHK